MKTTFNGRQPQNIKIGISKQPSYGSWLISSKGDSEENSEEILSVALLSPACFPTLIEKYFDRKKHQFRREFFNHKLEKFKRERKHFTHSTNARYILKYILKDFCSSEVYDHPLNHKIISKLWKSQWNYNL